MNLVASPTWLVALRYKYLISIGILTGVAVVSLDFKRQVQDRLANLARILLVGILGKW